METVGFRHRWLRSIDSKKSSRSLLQAESPSGVRGHLSFERGPKLQRKADQITGLRALRIGREDQSLAPPHLEDAERTHVLQGVPTERRQTRFRSEKVSSAREPFLRVSVFDLDHHSAYGIFLLVRKRDGDPETQEQSQGQPYQPIKFHLHNFQLKRGTHQQTGSA